MIHKLTVKLFTNFQNMSLCIFKPFKNSRVTLSSDIYVGYPPVYRCVLRNTLNPRGVIFSQLGIPVVIRATRLSQIAHAIVCPNTIDMV